MPIDVPYYRRPSRRKVPLFNHEILGAHWSQGSRPNREDEYLLVHGGSNRSPIFMALCDGIGGDEHGEVGAQNAVSSLSESHKLILGGKSHEQILRNLSSGINGAHQKILEELAKITGAAGTTVVAAVVKGGKAYVQHAGDSRAYLVTPKKVEQLTKDHVNNWGELTNAIGSKYVPPFTHQSGPITIPYGAALVLCTDGAWRGLKEHELGTIVAQPLSAQEMAKRIVETAEKNYGIDEASALVFLNRKVRKNKK